MRHLKTYNLFESDSWAGSLYAYNSKIAPIEADPVIEPRKTYTLSCEDCGVDFESFIIDGVCKKCGSENVKSGLTS
jgi:rRNA maturation endonuclease Nob1